MSLKNKIQLFGNVGNAPETKVLEGGKTVSKFSLATNESYKNDKGEKVTTTQWHNLIVWGKLADIVEKYISKGSEIAIEGKLTYRNYENKEGVKIYVTEIIVSELLMLDKKDS